MSQPAEIDPGRSQWSLAWQHRDRLLAIARRRTTCEHEAEDAVSEVLLRAGQNTDLADEALARWLTTVTINVCADLARERARSRRGAFSALHQLVHEPSAEQLVLDREQAATAALRLSALPARQREALLLRSAGFGVDQIADHLGVTYKTAESLLSRARAFMRKSVAVLAAILAGTWRHARRQAKLGPVVAVATAFAIATGMPDGGPGSSVTPAQSASGHRQHRPAMAEPSAVPSTGTAARSGRPSAARVRAPAPQPRRQPSVRSHTLRAGKFYARTPSVTRDRDDESLLETTVKCLGEFRVSARFIGCP